MIVRLKKSVEYFVLKSTRCCRPVRPLVEVTIMEESVKRLLFWTPRILCIAFAFFVSLLALDVFGEG